MGFSLRKFVLFLVGIFPEKICFVSVWRFVFFFQENHFNSKWEFTQKISSVPSGNLFRESALFVVGIFPEKISLFQVGTLYLL